MERRSCCSNLHFINAIKGNLVSKLRNVDANGKPALVFRAVKEIIEAEDAKRVQPSTSRGANCSDLRFRCARVKVESFSLPQVERSLREIDARENEFVCSGDDETGSNSDNDNFGEMTLKELKEKFKTKKRKQANSVPFKECLKFESEEDDSDLKEPLCSLKLKLQKAKKKCVQAASESPKSVILIKSERNPDSEVPFHRYLPSLVHVKTEVSDPMIKECQHVIPSVGDFPNINQSEESSIGDAISDRASNEVECKNSKSMLFAEPHQSCSINEVSYEHLENVEPIPLLFPSCEDTMDVDGQEESKESCQLDLPTSEYGTEETEEQPLLVPSPAKDDNSCMNSFSGSVRHMHDFLEQMSCHHAVPVSDLVTEDCSRGKDLYHGSDSLLFSDDAQKDLASDQQIGSPARTLSTPLNHPPCSSAVDALLCSPTEEKVPLLCSSPDGVGICLKTRNQSFLLEDKSNMDEHEQNKRSVTVGEEHEQNKRSVTVGEGKQERNSSIENRNCDVDETLPILVPVQPPERLLLTRKVISPTSQERLCLAMSSTESCINQNSKEHNASSLGSDAKHAKGSGVVNQTKVISPAKILKRKNDRRNSPPKVNLEGPRSLPSLNTGCTSLQGCSESAIAFSRRQMHDIESLALKLMSELKYMKDIVEEKLLFEAYRNVSLKNDADEVKDAITNAVKVEETARKWLSIMARDCNRFCKIMSLTQKGAAPVTSINGIQRERKKITFADEAGGMLCQVKVFGDEMAMESNSEKQKTQTI